MLYMLTQSIYLLLRNQSGSDTDWNEAERLLESLLDDSIPPKRANIPPKRAKKSQFLAKYHPWHMNQRSENVVGPIYNFVKSDTEEYI